MRICPPIAFLHHSLSVHDSFSSSYSFELVKSRPDMQITTPFLDSLMDFRGRALKQLRLNQGTQF